MASDVKWIKITTDIFDDEKILLIESLPDSSSVIVVWFKLLCLAGKMNNSGVFMMNNSIAYTDKMLSTIFRMKESTVTMALKTFEQFGMVEIIDGVITIPNWGKHQSLDQLEKKRISQREYMREYREKQKLLTCNTNCNTNSKANVSRPEEEGELDIKKENKENNTSCEKKPSKAEIDEFFDSLWQLYPVKKGKGQVSDTKRKALYEIGSDEMQRAIGRYLQELKKDADWRKPQNGSTFFCSGYVDYLDANFAPDETRKGGMTNANSGRNAYQSGYEEVGTWL